MDDPVDWMAMIDYRIAYGEARDHLEAERYSMGHGISFARRARDLADLVAKVVRRLGGDADVEAIREGVEDGLAGRRPRW